MAKPSYFYKPRGDRRSRKHGHLGVGGSLGIRYAESRLERRFDSSWNQCDRGVQPQQKPREEEWVD